MKKWIALILIVALLLPACSLAADYYIIPDSDTRLLTEYELWDWDYESLGFILNEIFARHGFNFEAGGEYYDYFNAQEWYQPNANPDNQKACYPQLSEIEWKNEAMVKEVRKQKADMNAYNFGPRNYLDAMNGIYPLPLFHFVYLPEGQSLAVYSAPGYDSFRGANGKAAVGTSSGDISVSGWEDGWLLVCYRVNNGAFRVGYVDGGSMNWTVPAPRLTFQYTEKTCVRNASLTDDPELSFTPLCRIEAGKKITLLGQYHNHDDWAYVETEINGQPVRGFIPLDTLE